MTLLHVGHGPGFFLPGLLATIVLTILIIKLLKHGRVGPVRWAGRGAGGSPEGERRPGQGFGPFGPGRAPWSQPSPEEAALATLAERLASGDITPEEYLERSSALRNTQPRGE